MNGHRLEVADVFHAHENELLQRWGHALSDQQRKMLRDIGLCRTAALGTHLERCDRCSYETVAYDSCHNRHCPKCQSSARDRWLLKQAASLLPVPYAHVVFTVPEQLAPLALRNQRLFYSLLFRAASETLLAIAADPRHLGARIGVLAVLHTWSQNLRHHPHLHCLVPAGGLALDNSCWIPSRRRGFFLPVRVLSRMFRGKLLAFLKQSYRREFIRRFLLHVLPPGFVKIRHFGLIANRNRRQALALCRLHLCTTANHQVGQQSQRKLARLGLIGHAPMLGCLPQLTAGAIQSP
jgi:Transposase zinc-binding domain/Putative transposase